LVFYSKSTILLDLNLLLRFVLIILLLRIVVFNGIVVDNTNLFIFEKAGEK